MGLENTTFDPQLVGSWSRGVWDEIIPIVKQDYIWVRHDDSAITPTSLLLSPYVLEPSPLSINLSNISTPLPPNYASHRGTRPLTLSHPQIPIT